MSVNQSRLDDNLQPLPISPDEMIIFKQSNVSLQIDSGTGYPATSINYLIPKGTLFLSSHRLLFIANYGNFRSFECPLDTLAPGTMKEPNPLLYLISEPASYTAPLKEIMANGGLYFPASIKFIFKEGGIHTFCDLIRQRSEMAQLIASADDDQLPAYDGQSEAAGPSA